MPDLDVLLPFLLAAEFREPWLPLWAMELGAKALLCAWLWYLGACIGSFLNVVVYRLPRGMNLVHPRSHCPRCGHPIRGRDNVPLFGWLLLKGKCRDCQARIPSRYFHVEAGVAMAFLAVAVLEAFVQRHGVYAPDISRPLLLRYDALPFWCAYATHVLLITTLIGAMLIDWDGFRTPWSLFVPVLIVGLALPIVWPEIRRLPAHRAVLDLPAWQAGLIDGLAGLGAGVLLGLVAGGAWWLGSRGRGWPKFRPVLLFAAAGVVVGWQRTLLIGPVVLVLFTLSTTALRIGGGRVVIPIAAFMLLGLAPWLVEIDADVSQVAALGESDRRALVAVIFIATALLWAAAGALAPPQYFVARHYEPPPPPGPVTISAEPTGAAREEPEESPGTPASPDPPASPSP
jgi:leader peptidase (prepilin peptidase)/N-methyltransferase